MGFYSIHLLDLQTLFGRQRIVFRFCKLAEFVACVAAHLMYARHIIDCASISQLIIRLNPGGGRVCHPPPEVVNEFASLSSRSDLMIDLNTTSWSIALHYKSQSLHPCKAYY